MDEKKNWIAGAINPNHKGKLRKRLHIKEGRIIPEKKLESASKKGGSLGREARLAETLRKIKK
jgi:hypothetical protein